MAGEDTSGGRNQYQKAMTYTLRQFLVFCVIIFIGFALRIYNLNFPSIGYHNMKENEYLSIAQEMQKQHNPALRRIYFYNAFNDTPDIKKIVTHPIVSYQILAAWKLFNQNLWAPRLFNVIFAILSIVIMYFLSLRLFQNTNISLFCASLSAIMPLGVFFSRNIQAESPAFFFMLLGSLFYLRSFSTNKQYGLILGGLSLCLAFLYEFKFIIGLIPLLFCAPLSAMVKKKNIFFKFIAAFFLPYTALAIYIGWLKLSGQWELNFRIRPFEIFSLSYWKSYGETIIWYIKSENFTLIYSFLALCGMLLACVRAAGLLNRYILGWIFSIIIYGLFFSETIHQNSFSYMPFLALVCISCAYTLLYISEEIKKVLKKNAFIYLALFTLILSIWPVYQSLSRMYGTVFWGVDVAGATFKELTSPEERIFLFAHPQGQGIARYAQRYMGTSESLEDFKEKEERHKVRFICFYLYPQDFLEILKKNAPDLFDYIRNSYHVKEIGLMEGASRIVYLILEKGFQEGKRLEDFSKTISGNLNTRAIYKVWGKHIFFYTIRP